MMASLVIYYKVLITFMLFKENVICDFDFSIVYSIKLEFYSIKYKFNKIKWTLHRVSLLKKCSYLQI